MHPLVALDLPSTLSLIAVPSPAADADVPASARRETAQSRKSGPLARCVALGGKSRRRPKAGSWGAVVERASQAELEEVGRLYEVLRMRVLVGQSNPQYLQKARDYVVWCGKWTPPYDPTQPDAESIGRYCTHWVTAFSSRSLPGLVSALRAVARDNVDWRLWSSPDDRVINKMVKQLMLDKVDIDKAKYVYPMMNRIRRRLYGAVVMWNLVQVQDAARGALAHSAMFRPQDAAAGRPRMSDFSFHETQVERVGRGNPNGAASGRSRMQYFVIRVRKGKTHARSASVPYDREEGLLSAYWWMAHYLRLVRECGGEAPARESFMFPLVRRSGSSFIVDWSCPMDDAAFYTRRAEACKAAGVPAWYVAGMGPYSDRSGGCEEAKRAGRSDEWIRRRGGWRSDAWKYYIRASFEQEACQCLGIDGLVAVTDLFQFGPASAERTNVWAPLRVRPTAQPQLVMFAAREVPRGRPQGRRVAP